MKKQVILIGAAGRMGGALVRCLQRQAVGDLELAGAVDLSTIPTQGEDIGLLSGTTAARIPLSADLPALLDDGRVFIDFSFHSGIAERGELLASRKSAWVIGTTGLSTEEREGVAQIAQRIPVVVSPNMSLGINLLAALVHQTATALREKGYDIEVIEKHHRKKLDAPSGTALFLGEAAARGNDWLLESVAKHGRRGMSSGERPDQEIGFHSLRGGDWVGDHDVIFAGDGEMLELSHRATSRDTFAIGALRAASWVYGQQPGLYTMKDVLGL